MLLPTRFVSLRFRSPSAPRRRKNRGTAKPLRNSPPVGFSGCRSSDGDRVARHLQKRATVDPRKTTCMLYLQADHQFFARYGTEEACIEVMTRHVQRVNSIYKHTGKSRISRISRTRYPRGSAAESE